MVLSPGINDRLVILYCGAFLFTRLVKLVKAYAPGPGV